LLYRLRAAWASSERFRTQLLRGAPRHEIISGMSEIIADFQSIMHASVIRLPAFKYHQPSSSPVDTPVCVLNATTWAYWYIEPMRQSSTHRIDGVILAVSSGFAIDIMGSVSTKQHSQPMVDTKKINSCYCLTECMGIWSCLVISGARRSCKRRICNKCSPSTFSFG